MENSKIQERITNEIQHLITKSCHSKKLAKEYEELHVALLKKYYNAANVQIDYKRKRIRMDIVFSDSDYRPGQVNINLPTLPTNMRFKNLQHFLSARLDLDRKSLAFYATLIRSLTKKEKALTMV